MSMRARESCEFVRHERNIHEGLAFTGENLFFAVAIIV